MAPSGTDGHQRSSSTFSEIVSPTNSTSLTRTEGRSSIDSERNVESDAAVHQNGVKEIASSDESYDSDDPIQRLQHELARTNEEKEKLATQYRNLLAKLTQMRTSLGNKLQQDAEELDRREQLVQQLTLEKEDLNATIETLQAELILSHKEAERSSSQLDAMRTRALQENAQETLHKERELRETQTELEKCRMEREEWERSALQEKAISEQLRSEVESLHRELELEGEARTRDTAELEREREKSENLQSVLQDFQSAKDHELRQAVKDYESQLLQTTQLLAEFKHRALTAELQLEESHTNISRTQELEKEVKEKNLLIGKLRHEAVIINEHLMEALRRLRRNSTDTNVDRRLVTNVLLSFLSTPRADSKRFEMLNLLASILQWSDQEREKAGLQRMGASEVASGSFWGRTSSTSSPAKSPAELEKSDETESFSRLWVEFLLTEAAAGESPSQTSRPRTGNGSIPNSPTMSGFPSSPLRNNRRLSSTGNASTPNLLSLGGPPLANSRKGRGEERIVFES